MTDSREDRHGPGSDPPSFSAINDPWIPVLLTDGSRTTISVREAFRRAPEIRSISPEFPQEELPILRLLIAVLYRAFARTDKNGGEIDEWGLDAFDDHPVLDLWFAIYRTGHFPLDMIDAYLDSIPGAADLFDPERPFFQTPGLQYANADKQSPISEHLPDVPDKDGKFLFSTRSKNSLGPISFAEAARILVFEQAYDVSGIHSAVKGSTTAKNGKEYAPKGLIGTGYLGAIGGLFNQGSNLFETLMLNWVLIGPSQSGQDRCLLGLDGDLAPWDDGYDVSRTQMVTDHVCTGPVDALTWQTRRLRPAPTDDGTRVGGLIITYGNVAQVLNADTTEMMTAWRESPQQLKRHPELPYALMPVWHQPDAYLWQGLPNLLGKVEHSDSVGNKLAPGIVQWADRLQDEQEDYLPADSDDVGSANSDVPLLPEVITMHSQGIVYGAQSAVIETGVDDSIQLDSRILQLGSDTASAVVSIVGEARQCIGYYRIFLQDLAIARGDDQQSAGQHVNISLEPVYVALDEVFRRHLRSLDTDSALLVTAQKWRDDIHRTLLDAARDELRTSPAPAFGEHTFERGKFQGQVATSAKAMSVLSTLLRKVLGPMPDGNHDSADVAGLGSRQMNDNREQEEVNGQAE